jgi:hypothetical protein
MQSMIIATIAFSCVPMMGFSQTPPEVWGCDATEAKIFDTEFFDSGEATVRLEDEGLVYIRPSTNEWFDKDRWQNICDDGDETLQVILTEYGCNIVDINERFVSLGSWSVDLDSKEAHFHTTKFGVPYPSWTVSKLSNCKVTSPLLFE